MGCSPLDRRERLCADERRLLREHAGRAEPRVDPAHAGVAALDDGALFDCEEPVTPPDREPTPLSAADAPDALALAELTRRGPFGPRTIELGRYLGFRDGGRLVVSRMQSRGDLPFLHVQVGSASQASAIALYERLGFRGRRRSFLAVLRRRAERESLEA